MQTNEINSILDLVAPLRTAPFSEMLKKLKSDSLETDIQQDEDRVRMALHDAHGTRSEKDGSSGGDVHDVQEVRTPPLRPRTSVSSPQDSAQTVQAIYGAIKGKKLTGDALQSIDESIRDYNILAFQLVMKDAMKSKFFICIFEDAAKSHFISNVREDMSFEEMENVMR